MPLHTNAARSRRHQSIDCERFLRRECALPRTAHNTCQHRLTLRGIVNPSIRPALGGTQAPTFVVVWCAVLSSYREDDIQTNTYRDHWNRVDKAQNDEQLGTQHWQQFGLTSNTLKKFTTQYAYANRGADCTQSHHQTTGNKQKFHFNSNLTVKNRGLAA